jgi:hypothetical protein
MTPCPRWAAQPGAENRRSDRAQRLLAWGLWRFLRRTELGHLAELRRDRLYRSQLATWRALLQREGEAGIEAKLPLGARRLRKPRTGTVVACRAGRRENMSGWQIGRLGV